MTCLAIQGSHRHYRHHSESHPAVYDTECGRETADLDSLKFVGDSEIHRTGSGAWDVDTIRIYDVDCVECLNAARTRRRRIADTLDRELAQLARFLQERTEGVA